MLTLAQPRATRSRELLRRHARAAVQGDRDPVASTMSVTRWQSSFGAVRTCRGRCRSPARSSRRRSRWMKSSALERLRRSASSSASSSTPLIPSISPSTARRSARASATTSRHSRFSSTLSPEPSNRTEFQPFARHGGSPPDRDSGRGGARPARDRCGHGRPHRVQQSAPIDSTVFTDVWTISGARTPRPPRAPPPSSGR